MQNADAVATNAKHSITVYYCCRAVRSAEVCLNRPTSQTLSPYGRSWRIVELYKRDTASQRGQNGLCVSWFTSENIKFHEWSPSTSLETHITFSLTQAHQL